MPFILFINNGIIKMFSQISLHPMRQSRNFIVWGGGGGGGGGGDGVQVHLTEKSSNKVF